jgi:hypothetical protein
LIRRFHCCGTAEDDAPTEDITSQDLGHRKLLDQRRCSSIRILFL